MRVPPAVRNPILHFISQIEEFMQNDMNSDKMIDLFCKARADLKITHKLLEGVRCLNSTNASLNNVYKAFEGLVAMSEIAEAFFQLAKQAEIQPHSTLWLDNEHQLGFRVMIDTISKIEMVSKNNSNPESIEVLGDMLILPQFVVTVNIYRGEDSQLTGNEKIQLLTMKVFELFLSANEELTPEQVFEFMNVIAVDNATKVCPRHNHGCSLPLETTLGVWRVALNGETWYESKGAESIHPDEENKTLYNNAKKFIHSAMIGELATCYKEAGYSEYYQSLQSAFHFLTGEDENNVEKSRLTVADLIQKFMKVKDKISEDDQVHEVYHQLSQGLFPRNIRSLSKSSEVLAIPFLHKYYSSVRTIKTTTAITVPVGVLLARITSIPSKL